MTVSIESKMKSHMRFKRQVHVLLGIPYSDPINGFPLKIQGELLLLQSIENFRVNGYTIVKIADILSFRSNRFERFSEKILKGEGETGKILSPRNIELNHWKASLESLSKTGENIIVEWYDEKDDDAVFFIGKVDHLNKKTISFKQFDAAGKWHDPSPVPYKNIINISFRSRYIEMFTKYLGNK